MRFSKKILVTSLIIIIAFTAYVCYVNSKGVEVSEVLIEKVYDFFGYEIMALAGIKVGETLFKKEQ